MRARAGEVLVEIPEEVVVADQVDQLDEALDLREALATLSGDCAEILDRFFGRDESYRTIAAALELPAGTIASRISRCLTKLRAQIEADEGRKSTLVASSD